MMKRGKFRDDSASVLSHQLHALAVRRYLSTTPEPQQKRPQPLRMVRTRSKKARYRWLAAFTRLFPLLIGVACVFVLWNGQSREARFRARQIAAAQSGEVLSDAGHHQHRTQATDPVDSIIDESMTFSRAPVRDGLRNVASDSFLPSQYLLGLMAPVHDSSPPDERTGMQGPTTR